MIDAIVLGGGQPQPGEPLYDYTGGKSKALLEIAGQPMIQWVLDALDASPQVGQIVVVGLDESAGLHASHPLIYLPDQGKVLSNIIVAARHLLKVRPATQAFLAVSGDIPALTAECVDWVAGMVARHHAEVYYSVVPRQVMETRFPDSHRTYARLKDAEVCGGDLNAFSMTALDSNLALWRALEAGRKSVLRQALTIGLDTLLLLLFRQLTIDAAVARVGQRLGLRAKALVSPYAELGMDVDKPAQLEMLRRDLTSRRTAPHG